MSDCPFCGRIERREYDDAGGGWVSFEPLNPVTPGHRLFVTSEHVETAASAPFPAAEAFAAAAMYAQREGSDCNLITSVGPAATQTVKHAHIHFVPRREGDGLTLPWTGQKSGDGGWQIADNDAKAGRIERLEEALRWFAEAEAATFLDASNDMLWQWIADAKRVLEDEA